MDPKTALETKKKKLEELKRKRQAREEERRKAQLAAEKATVAPVSTPEATRASSTVDPTSILSNVAHILNEPSTASNATTASAARSDGAARSSSSVAVQAELGVGRGDNVDIEPISREVYEIGVQAGESLEQKLKQELDEEEKERLKAEVREQKRRDREREEEEEKLRKQREEEERKKRTITTSERKMIEESADFRSFFANATKLVERALAANNRYDITVDYSDVKEDDGQSGRALLHSSQKYFSADHCLDRPVTAVDWSPRHTNLVLTANGKQKERSSLMPDGQVLVWDTFVWDENVETAPEYRFQCQSAVLTAQWHPSDPLIIAGTESGQVVLWDTRVNRRTPVSRTTLASGQTQPVHAICAVPTAGAVHDIISVSTDGRVCVWNDRKLSEPKETIQLKWNDTNVSPTCFAFPGLDPTNIMFGSEEGKLYGANLYGKAQGDVVKDAIDAHEAPVVALRYHPSEKSEFANHYLSCSFDWTTKLWGRNSKKPLLTFTAKDYVYDVQWSPTHPAVFAMGDGTGHVEIWNMSTQHGTEVAAQRINALGSSDEAKGIGKTRAVSRLQWSANGKQLAVGASDGSLHVFKVSQDVYQPKDGDEAAFYEKLKVAMEASA